AQQPVEHEGAGGGAVGVLPEADFRLVVAPARLEHLDEPAEGGIVVAPVVVHHRRSGVVRDGDGREARVGGEPPPEPVRGGAALGEGGEDRGPPGDFALYDVLPCSAEVHSKPYSGTKRPGTCSRSAIFWMLHHW